MALACCKAGIASQRIARYGTNHDDLFCCWRDLMVLRRGGRQVG